MPLFYIKQNSIDITPVIKIISTNSLIYRSKSGFITAYQFLRIHISLMLFYIYNYTEL